MVSLFSPHALPPTASRGLRYSTREHLASSLIGVVHLLIHAHSE